MFDYLTRMDKKLCKALEHEKGKPRVHDAFSPARKCRAIWGSDAPLYPGLDYDRELFISQGKKECAELLRVVKKLKKRDTGLEIGFFRGGTHIIFRDFFEKFISVEINPNWFLPYLQTEIFDERSEFIVGPSTHPKVLGTVKELSNGVLDFIFIDGDHSYAGVKKDFLCYWPMLSQGGLIVLHDYKHPTLFGISEFLIELEEHHFKIKYINIDYSGIAYILKDDQNCNLNLPPNNIIWITYDIEANTKIVLYGAGELGSLWKKAIEKEREDVTIVCYADSYKKGSKDNLSIINMEYLEKKQQEFDCIIVTSLYHTEITNSLRDKNIKNFCIAQHPPFQPT